MRPFALLPAALLALALTPSAAAEGSKAAPDAGSPEPASVHYIPRLHEGILLDGTPDEAAWRDAWSAELRWEVNPGENVPAPVRTEVLVAYDEKAVYFAFRAFDPDPAAIRAKLADRDQTGGDDWVAVILDTFNDERRSFDLFVNPLGVQGDSIETSGGEEGWDAIWDSAAHIHDWGWSVEMRVPFTSLRFQPASGPQVWGFDAVRSYPRTVRHHIGAFPRDRGNNCYFCQLLKIKGFDGAETGNNIEIDPTATAVRTDAAPSAGAALEPGSVDTELGVTARWGITPGLTLAATLNPDFSQIESDALQLDVNEPFALSYAERRPFFMEASDFFSTRLSAVYTRAVRDPAWGAKLTGKLGGDTVGAFVVRDEVTNLLLPGAQSSRGFVLESESTAAVARYKHDFGSTLTLGTLATTRQAEGYSNGVVGFDGDWRIARGERLRVQLLGSRTRYPEEVAGRLGQPEGAFSDWAGELFYYHTTPHFDAWAALRDVGADFRADLGFMPRVGTRVADAGFAYQWLPSRRTWWSMFQVDAAAKEARTRDGEHLYRESMVDLVYQGPLQSHALVSYTTRRETWAGQEFDKNDLRLHYCAVPSGATGFYTNVYVGDQIDYANARLGSRVRATAGLDQRVGRHLSFDLDATWERMRVEGERLYVARIGEARATYQITARSFVRAIAQLVGYRYNQAMYSDGRGPGDRELLTQLLFSYKLNPQTVLYVGYGDVSEGEWEQPLERASRTLFAKVGYAWNL